MDPSNRQFSSHVLATLAHELRNPLAAILMALRIIEEDGANGSSARQAREDAERQAQHMVRIIDDMLDVFRGVRGKLTLRLERVELANIVASAIETARPLLEASNHELTVSLPPAPFFLRADPARLEQILTNLLINAAKFTEAGGSIRLSAEAGKDAVMIRVRDSGIGISADLLPRIFDPFEQGGARGRWQSGLGIGLALVRSLVELHGGWVRAASPGPGAGSEFIVRLPTSPRP
jgi:signal transduction histidine kinase